MATSFTCAICGFVATGKSFTNHLAREHSLKARDYAIQHLYGGTAPTCPACGDEPRYVALTFKKYCRRHSSLAEAEAGKVGGKMKRTWNRGKKAANDPRIAVMTGESNPFFGRKHSEESLRKISDSKRLTEAELADRVTNSPSSRYWTPAYVYSEYQGRQVPYPPLRFICKTCARVDFRHLYDIERGTRCHSCFPIGSVPEQEIADFVRGLGLEVEQNTRKVIPPKEIDIWVPAARLGIEHHGLYWHSGGVDRDPTYTRELHRDKRVLAKGVGARLFQIFSDEWRDRREIVESMVTQRLGKVGNLVSARGCRVVELSHVDSRGFFDATHIDGSTPARLSLGLADRDGVCVAMSFRKPVQKRHGNVIELARLSTRLRTIVRGGVSRLLAHVRGPLVRDGFTGILSYADLRFGEGKVYERLGFRRVGETNLNYWYTDGERRYDRFAYRAQDGIPEREVAARANVRPVWGAGHAIYVLSF